MFARSLAARIHLPIVELDTLYWEPDWRPADPETFRQRVLEKTSGDGWIVVGNYGAVRGALWSRATMVFWLNYGFAVTFSRALRRTTRRAITREMLWNGNRESIRRSFFSRESILWWIITTHRRRREEMNRLRVSNEYRHLRWVEFQQPMEAEAYLGSQIGFALIKVGLIVRRTVNPGSRRLARFVTIHLKLEAKTMRASAGSILAVIAAAGLTILWFRQEQVGEKPIERASTQDGVGTVATSPPTSETTLTQGSRNPNPVNNDTTFQTSNLTAGSSSSAPMSLDQQTPDRETRASNSVRALTFAGRKQSAEGAKTADGADQKKPVLQQTRITCEFATGYNNGLVWEGKLTSGSAAWQGGPLTYDAIDAEAGTAQLLGSESATGSMEGHADTRVAVGATRVEFLSTLANAQLVLTTVFSERDEQGRYIAVMSRHEGPSGAGIFGSQFLGWCR